MDIEYGVAGRFTANHGRCEWADRPHGHRYRVQVFCTGELDPETGMIRGSDGLREYLTDYLRSLAYQDLDEVLPATVTSITGVAAAIMGRLVPRFPRVSEVTVTADDEMGRVRRTPRAL